MQRRPEPNAAAAPKAGDAPTNRHAARSDAATTTQAWPGWLGPDRNGRVGWLPHELADEPHIVWRRPLGRAGMGGLAATDRHVFVGDRDAANRADVFRCLDAATGDELWIVTYPDARPARLRQLAAGHAADSRRPRLLLRRLRRSHLRRR